LLYIFKLLDIIVHVDQILVLHHIHHIHHPDPEEEDIPKKVTDTTEEVEVDPLEKITIVKKAPAIRDHNLIPDHHPV
jgi:hypothetical protein